MDKQAILFLRQIEMLKAHAQNIKSQAVQMFTIYSYCIIRTGVVLAAGLPGQRGEGGQAGLEGIVRRQSQLQKG